MKHQYLYGLQRGEKVYGIPDEDTLERLICKGNLLSSDMLFCYRRGIWSPAGELPELKSRFSHANSDENECITAAETNNLSAYASVGGTKNLFGDLKIKKSEAGAVNSDGVPPPDDSRDSGDSGRERRKSSLLIVIILLLLLLMSVLLAARLYISCADDTQLSYYIDNEFTSTGTNSHTSLIDPQY